MSRSKQTQRPRPHADRRSERFAWAMVIASMVCCSHASLYIYAQDQSTAHFAAVANGCTLSKLFDDQSSNCKHRTSSQDGTRFWFGLMKTGRRCRGPAATDELDRTHRCGKSDQLKWPLRYTRTNTTIAHAGRKRSMGQQAWGLASKGAAVPSCVRSALQHTSACTYRGADSKVPLWQGKGPLA